MSVLLRVPTSAREMRNLASRSLCPKLPPRHRCLPLPTSSASSFRARAESPTKSSSASTTCAQELQFIATSSPVREELRRRVQRHTQKIAVPYRTEHISCSHIRFSGLPDASKANHHTRHHSHTASTTANTEDGASVPPTSQGFLNLFRDLREVYFTSLSAERTVRCGSRGSGTVTSRQSQDVSREIK